MGSGDSDVPLIIFDDFHFSVRRTQPKFHLSGYATIRCDSTSQATMISLRQTEAPSPSLHSPQGNPTLEQPLRSPAETNYRLPAAIDSEVMYIVTCGDHVAYPSQTFPGIYWNALGTTCHAS